MNILVTGSAGLIGSAVARFYCERNATVIGIDNDLRRAFFGHGATTTPIADELIARYPNYRHSAVDIRDKNALMAMFRAQQFDLIVHAAAQPSHEWAAGNPLTDFAINAAATVHLLELTRLHSPEAVFVFLSTNKVYGDRPNKLPLREQQTRWDLSRDHPCYDGLVEDMSVDACTHSIFGGSKLSGDIMSQEYGRYFGLRTVVFRCGCITGGSHAGSALHGFLSHLVRCVVHGKPYSIIGYGGKQVRDNLHADDVAAAIEEFRLRPSPASVYNMGGGRSRSVSVLEALELAATVTGNIPVLGDMIAEPRKGDHLWYITSTASFERDYPAWRPTYTLDDMIYEIARRATTSRKTTTEKRSAALQGRGPTRMSTFVFDSPALSIPALPKTRRGWQ